MNILIYSIPFGFGPTGKAITIASQLKHKHNITLATFNHSLQLANEETDVEVYNCESRMFSKWNKDVVENSELIISIMDLKFVHYLTMNFPSKRVIYFDSLFWWRKSLSEFSLLDNVTYLLQFFPTIEKNFSKIPKEHLNNFIIINPLVSNIKKTSKNNTITIHYGGVNSLIIDWTKYINFFLFLTEKLIIHLNHYSLHFVGNKELMATLSNHFAKDKIKFDCLSQKEFKKTISNSKFLFTTCGIESTYDAFNCDIPVVFLPPLNSTQLHQINILESNNCRTILTSKQKDTYLKIIKSELEYELETKTLAFVLDELIKNEKEKLEYDYILKNLSNVIKNENEITNIVENQRLFFKKDFSNGIDEINRIIKKTNAQQRI